MNTYPSIEAYTSDVTAARNAYAADEAVRAGFCARLCGRKKDGEHRMCWRCRHEGRRDGVS